MALKTQNLIYVYLFYIYVFIINVCFINFFLSAALRSSKILVGRLVGPKTL